MVKKGDSEECVLRIDPVLVDKFRRLQGGINEVGTKIVRDLGLRYQYDKKRGTLEIIGQDSEILALAVETLRFWVEDDDFPDTGITCQVGYPNRCIVIWRFHGDYAKKFDHLFSEDISKLKLITSVNIKAVPNKRNPEYVELYCHFSVYHQVKPEVVRIAKELAKIFQQDFFIPKSDFQKARDFAISKAADDKVLYALKEYPDNKIRVWLFARDQMDVIRARKEWVLHVGIIARDNEFTETVTRDRDSFKSASFFGHPASEVDSDIFAPTTQNKHRMADDKKARARRMTKTSLNLSSSMVSLKSQTKSHISPRTPRSDNPNFPRPSDFPYPIQKVPDPSESVPDIEEEFQKPKNLFEGNAAHLDEANNKKESNNPAEGKWITEDESNLNRGRKLSLHQPSNRIYVHHQINDPDFLNQSNSSTTQPVPPPILNAVTEGKLTQVVHPEKNLIEKERFNPTHQAVLTSVTDPRQAPKIKRGNKTVRPGGKGFKKPGTIQATTRQKRPTLKNKKPPPSIRYHINVNGLEIFMYKQNIAKLGNMDALVNVVSNNLKDGDEVANIMKEEAGKQVEDELDVHLSLYGNANNTENVVTSAGKLASLGIIHVVSPVWKNYTVWQDCASDLHKSLYNALKTAETHKYRKIGIPTIGSEPFFGIPKDLVAEVYVKALIDYSMGMGPMYPVLEIHLVDMDPNMLTYIKDAYESWAATPGVVDMTRHIKTGTDQIISDPNEVSNRSQSAVSLKSMPAHRSENMVTFVDQSYTKEGEQKWTFDVLKKLTVHVYTGSILKLDDVEAIVCAVDVNMKGTLAKQIQFLGGKKYQTALKAARGNRTLVEGEVLTCDAGELPVKTVLHSVISAPIHSVSQKNLSRLDAINTQVFLEASRMNLKSLAMPLIGTGRLRERFEVEQCSLQLIDNVIEMCLSLGNGLKLKELHLVNTNHVMTQYLTQALRTRAHTKLRVETEPHFPSRQDVLTKAEAIRHTPDKVERLSARSYGSKGSNSKAENPGKENQKGGENAGEKKSDKKIPKSNKPDDQLSRDHKQAEAHLLPKEEDDNLRNNTDKAENVQPKKAEAQEHFDVKDLGAKKINEEGIDKQRAPYLSQKNLEKHNKLVQDAWMHLMDEEMEGIEYKAQRTQKKKEHPKRHQQLEPLNEGFIVKKADEFLKERKSENKRLKKRKKHRIVQRSSDFVMQRSKAESYKTLFEKKQKFAEDQHKQEQYKLRKTQSSDDILKKQIANAVFETFKEERKKLLLQKKLASKPDQELTEEERNERDTYLKENKKYFTRDTNDRYKSKSEQIGEDVNDKFERINRLNVVDGDGDKSFNRFEREVKTDRSVKPSGIPKLKRPRQLIDKEREDQYMMDMDFIVKEREMRQLEKKDETDVDDESKAEGVQDKDFSKSERSVKLRRDRYIKLTSEEKHNKASGINQKRSHPKSRPKKPALKPKEKHQSKEKAVTSRKQDDAHQDRDRNLGLEMADSGISLQEPDNDGNVIEMSIGVAKPHSSNNVVTTDEVKITENERKTAKTYTVKGKNGQEVGPSNHAINPPETHGDSEIGRAHFIQSYNPTPRYNQPPIPNKTVEWKNGMKVTKEALQQFNEQRRHFTVRAPKPNEVTIRDKIKLKINVVDNKSVDSEEVKAEKRKIKRFWEVVDSKSIKSERELYGESEKDKVIVATVTKERVMSAKSKSSKHSKSYQSVTTHNVGPFDVTLEVAK